MPAPLYANELCLSAPATHPSQGEDASYIRGSMHALHGGCNAMPCRDAII